MVDYNKRQTIPNTAHGTVYQIYNSIYYAFTYAYKQKIPFELHTEDTGYGDFDDLVLILPDKVTAMQLKHRKEESAANSKELSFSDFITGSSKGHKLTLYKYFDSLSDKLATEKFDKHDFQLVSNYELPTELRRCIDPESGKFTDKFLSGDDSETWLTRTLIVASIEQNSKNEEIKKNNLLNSQQYGSVLTKFLQLATEYLTKAIKKSLFTFIKTYFPLHKKKFPRMSSKKSLKTSSTQ